LTKVKVGSLPDTQNAPSQHKKGQLTRVKE